MKISYYGVAAFRIELDDGRGITFDPYLELSPIGWEEFPKSEYMVVSHGAGDHMGNAFDLIKRDGSRLLAPHCVISYAKMNGVPQERCRNMVSGAYKEYDGIGFKAVWANHISMIHVSETEFITGQPLGFIVTLPNGIKVYHMGDTSIFSDIKLIGELYQPDIVLLPIGMLRGEVSEMDAHEAALAAQWLNPKMVIPMHYDLISEKDSPRILTEDMKVRAKHIEVCRMAPGETIQVNKDLSYQRL